MLFGQIFESFVIASPITVMARATFEFALEPTFLDQIFEEHAEHQYSHKLMYSTLVEVTSLVICGIESSHNQAYQQHKDKIGVSMSAMYQKLSKMETGISTATVSHVAERLIPVVDQLHGRMPSLLEGFQVRFLDGNHLAATEHRIAESRTLSAAPLPGFALVLMDQQTGLVTNVVACENGHTQERALLDQIIPLVNANDVIVADRNFCTNDFLIEIMDSDAYFVIRQHATNAPCVLLGERKYCGRSDTGKVFEQAAQLIGPTGEVIKIRRITIELKTPTRDGDTEIHILTNLPAKLVLAIQVAEVYRARWTIEKCFGELAQSLSCEIKTLCYPGAALFCFCVGLCVFNVLGVMKAALRAEHGAKVIDEEFSSYYMSEEISRIHDGMMISIPDAEWEVFANLSPGGMAARLRYLARRVDLRKFRKNKRGPKKPVKKEAYNRKKPHVATATLLQKRKEVA